ncbi:DUF2784 domain-containing protein [Vibrio alfacsensis]|uniref:DUF2784 domain-containing protein n=1 Tax=Vibrio alfacsensis TaxID=1074311 RepID=UPI0040676207
MENQLRQAAGDEGYQGGFVEHYIIPIIYPVELHFDVQVLLGLAALGINIVIYVLVYYRYKLNQGR